MDLCKPGKLITVYVSQEGLEGSSLTKVVRNMLVREGLSCIVKSSVKSILCRPGLTVKDAVTEVGFTVSVWMTRFWNNQRPGTALKLQR